MLFNNCKQIIKICYYTVLILIIYTCYLSLRYTVNYVYSQKQQKVRFVAVCRDLICTPRMINNTYVKVYI